MGIEQWWSTLDPSSRRWLVEHNGEPIPDEIVAKIRDAGGTVRTAGPDDDAPGAHLSDDEIDQVEAWANEEPEQG